MRKSALVSFGLAALLLTTEAGWGRGFGGGGGGFGGGGFGRGGFGGGGFGRGGFGRGGFGFRGFGAGHGFMLRGTGFGRFGNFGFGRGGFGGLAGIGRNRGGNYFGWYPWLYGGYPYDQPQMVYDPSTSVFVRAPAAPAARPQEFGKFVSAPKGSRSSIASASFGCRHGHTIRLESDQGSRPATIACVSP